MATTLLAAAAKSAAGPHAGLTRAVEALPHTPTNLSSPERWLSFIGGGALLALGTDGRGPGLFSALAGSYLLYRAATGHCVGYQLMGVSTSDATAPNSVIAAGHGTRVDHEVVVNRPAADVYRFWRDFENLPRFMTHLVSVNTSTDGRSRWVAKGPLGLKLEWEAELIADTPHRLISWRSLPGADVDTAGAVTFTELPGRGTRVRVELKYDPPLGQVGTAVAKLFGENPDRQVREDLERFRQVMESQPASTPMMTMNQPTRAGGPSPQGGRK